MNFPLKKIALSLALSIPILPSWAVVSDYKTSEQIERSLQNLAQKYPARIKLETIGKSAGGQTLYLVQIAGPGKVAPNKRPAVFVAANMAGFHHAGSEAALHLIEHLSNSNDKQIEDLLAQRSFYIAPLLNPDAHIALFKTPKQVREGNSSKIDRDLDGLIEEDGPDDLDGNGIITQMRIKDLSGDMIIDPSDSRRMIKADASKGQRGQYRVFTEGNDNDKDGLYNEDGIGGVQPDRNFAAGFQVADAQFGAWPGIAPETKAIMDAIIARPNIAMAIVYGPANQLLSPPKGFDRPTPAGAKPSNEANRYEAEDLKILSNLADPYKKALDVAKLDNKRSGKQTMPGSLSNWLYFHHGVMTIEVDVWGIPKTQTAKNSDTNKTDKSEATNSNQTDLFTYIDTQAPQAFTAWKSVTLSNGVKAEVGGFDAFVEYAPKQNQLQPALTVHTEQILTWANKLAELEFIETKVEHQGNDVWRITAIGGMKGELPTHSKLAARMRNQIPVRMEMKPGQGVSPLTLNRASIQERLEPSSTIKGEWLVKARAGTQVELALWCNHAGQTRSVITLEKAN
jgi:hypothetical protein